MQLKEQTFGVSSFVRVAQLVSSTRLLIERSQVQILPRTIFHFFRKWNKIQIANLVPPFQIKGGGKGETWFPL